MFSTVPDAFRRPAVSRRELRASVLLDVVLIAIIVLSAETLPMVTVIFIARDSWEAASAFSGVHLIAVIFVLFAFFRTFRRYRAGWVAI